MMNLLVDKAALHETCRRRRISTPIPHRGHTAATCKDLCIISEAKPSENCGHPGHTSRSFIDLSGHELLALRKSTQVSIRACGRINLASPYLAIHTLAGLLRDNQTHHASEHQRWA